MHLPGSAVFFILVKLILVKVPIAFTISILATAAISVALVCTMLLCLSYRLVWYATPAGRIHRRSKQFEKRIEKIKSRARMRRTRLSRRSDQQNIKELVAIVRKKLDQRKNDILINLRVLVRIQLSDCMRKSDFSTALEIHQALSQTDADMSNHLLRQLVGLNQRG